MRRWSDQGLLPVQRIGLRRTRRFAEEDLRKFSADAHPMTGSPQGTSEVDGATVGRVQVQLVRVVGEMVSVRRLFPSEAEMMDFEAAFSALIQRFPAVVLSQYDVREFDGHGIITAAKAHPDLFELRFSDFLT